MINSKLGKSGFSILTIKTVNDIVNSGIDKNSILHGSAQYSVDSSLVWVAGEHSNAELYFKSGKELHQHIASVEWAGDGDGEE